MPYREELSLSFLRRKIIVIIITISLRTVASTIHYCSCGWKLCFCEQPILLYIYYNAYFITLVLNKFVSCFLRISKLCIRDFHPNLVKISLTLRSSLGKGPKEHAAVPGENVPFSCFYLFFKVWWRRCTWKVQQLLHKYSWKDGKSSSPHAFSCTVIYQSDLSVVVWVLRIDKYSKYQVIINIRVVILPTQNLCQWQWNRKSHRSPRGKRVYTGILIRFLSTGKIVTSAFYQTIVSLEIIEIQAF